jgi:hypothetical protein
MQALNDLRQAARDRRDKLIAKARDEYETTLAKIASIEQDLLGREPGSFRSVQASVESVIPSDRQFTVADVVLALETADPRRTWSSRSIGNCISRLCGKGLLRRLSKQRRGGKHHGSDPAVYVRADCQTEPRPFQGMELKDALYETLQGKSLTTLELAVTIRELGWQTSMKPRGFREYVGRRLRDDERFKRVGERWRCA